MERSLLLVDAGYLLAQGGLAIHGTRSRNLLSIEAGAFLRTLTAQITEHSGLPLLRTYWYDGARHGMPTPEHLAIAQLPYLKLRLGRLNSNKRQKGVDALIYRDLMTLASERSIAQAYLLSGDDDLREGVLFAQDRGVRVVLLGISGRRGRPSVSRELTYEADEVIMLDDSLISRHLKYTPQSRPATTLVPKPPRRSASEHDVAAAAKSFTELWRSSSNEATRMSLIEGYPRIPKTIDVNLMKSCEDLLGSKLWDSQDLKKVARQAFWQIIRATNS
jgi:uncharacterized LabA/DUF88 family protein